MNLSTKYDQACNETIRILLYIDDKYFNLLFGENSKIIYFNFCLIVSGSPNT